MQAWLVFCDRKNLAQRRSAPANPANADSIPRWSESQWRERPQTDGRVFGDRPMNLRYLSILALASTAALAGCGGHSAIPQPPAGWKEKMAATSPSDKPVVAVVAPRLTIRTAEDWSLSETAADSLSRIGASAVPALIEMLREPDPATRERAAKILAGIGPDASAAVSMLQTTTHDSDPAVRRWSVRALGQIGEAAGPAVPDLIQALRETEPEPRTRVIPVPTTNVPVTPGPNPPIIPPPTRTPGTLM